MVKPHAGLATGTQIRNRARIVFELNDAIETPQVFNTIDSGAPTSTVALLPAEAGPAILVQWSGQDDAGGSGLANYDVYVIADGTNQFRWLERTTATSAWWNGTLGSTYAFYSLARDNVGHEEPAPATTDATVFVPTNAPVLSDITNRVTDVGNLMLITNTVAGTPVGSFTFSLGTPAPFGATINPTNGILRWTPNCTQASRMHTLTIFVTDTGNPNLRDIRTFTVVTRECVVPELGRVVLQAGDSGRVPVNLISTVPLTNLSMTVEVPAGRLTNFSVESIVAEICEATVEPGRVAFHRDPNIPGEESDATTPHPGPLLERGGEGDKAASGASPLPGGEGQGEGERYLLTLATCPNQFLIGTQQLAWLHFTAISNQSSAFVPLLLDNAVGQQPDGSEVRNFAPQAGRVVVVGEEPLLEAILASNRQPALILYGLSGPGYVIEGKPRWDASLPWQVIWEGTQTNLFQQIQPIGGTNRMMFFRARRTVPTAALRLEAKLVANQQVMLLLHGQPGERYAIESKASLDVSTAWQPMWQGVVSSAQEQIPALLATNRTMFFRAVRQ